MKEVLYVGMYDSDAFRAEKRACTLSAVNKMNYIIGALQKAGYRVRVVSPAWTGLSSGRFPERTTPLSDNAELVCCSSFGAKGKLRRLLRVFHSMLWLFWFLLRHVGNEDTLLVYHALAYASTVQFLKKLKGFRLVLEVEEIYADVNGSEKARSLEYNLFEKADAYIFPTELLNEKINTSGKPYSIIYGTYQVETDRYCSFGDDKIHVVYAGIVDPRKGGGAAAAAAEFLPENYHVHILGFGTKDDTENLKQVILEVSKRSVAKVTYDGLRSGEDYIRFIQSCQIGLCTQDPNATFNDTSFPSKILSYMANGLHVVSIRIPAVERSAVGDLIEYYHNQTPEAIAQAIMKVNVKAPYNSRQRIEKLDNSFVLQLYRLLEGNGS